MGSNVLFQPEDFVMAGCPKQNVVFPILDELNLLDKPRKLIGFLSGLEVNPKWETYYNELYNFLAGRFGSSDTMKVFLFI